VVVLLWLCGGVVAALCWYWKLWEVGFVVREFVLFCSFVVVVLVVVWWCCVGVGKYGEFILWCERFCCFVV